MNDETCAVHFVELFRTAQMNRHFRSLSPRHLGEPLSGPTACRRWGAAGCAPTKPGDVKFAATNRCDVSPARWAAVTMSLIVHITSGTLFDASTVRTRPSRL